jgi:uncharacterized damage-inducible protein DinB
MDRDHVLQLCAYHHWAEDQLMACVQPLTAAQLDKPWGGSFATGRGLLRHIVGADRIWVTRWNGTSPKAAPPVPDSWAGADFRAEWEKVKAEEQRFLNTLTDARLEESFTYVNLKGEQSTYRFADILVHVVNHGTYHRGQLAHLLRDLGVTPPSTDYLIFRRDNG